MRTWPPSTFSFVFQQQTNTALSDQSNVRGQLVDIRRSIVAMSLPLESLSWHGTLRKKVDSQISTTIEKEAMELKAKPERNSNTDTNVSSISIKGITMMDMLFVWNCSNLVKELSSTNRNEG